MARGGGQVSVKQLHPEMDLTKPNLTEIILFLNQRHWPILHIFVGLEYGKKSLPRVFC